MNRRTAVGVLGCLAFGTVAAASGRRARATSVHADAGADRRPVLPGPGSHSRSHLRGQARRAATAHSPRVRGLRVLRADPPCRRGRLAMRCARHLLRFRTIYPGWYQGRTPHVHLKLRVGAKAATTQLYFPDEVTNAVYARAPYDRHPNRDTTNATYRFLGPIGDKSLVMWTMARDGDGYVAAATVALRTS